LLGAISLFGATLALAQGAAPATQSAAAETPQAGTTSLAEQIGALLAEPGVAEAHWGIAVTKLDGTPIYTWNDAQLFRPASVAKLFTTAAAMSLLVPTATTATEMRFARPNAAGTVVGDLALVGHGDANLSGRALPYASSAAAEGSPWREPLRGVDALADRLVQAGVRRITGDLVATGGLWEPYPQGWGTDDLLWGYGAPVSLLAVDDNTVRLVMLPAARAGEPATVQLVPDVGYYRIEGTVHTVRAGAEASVARDPGSRVIHVSGSVALGRPYATELAVEDPPLYAGLALAQELRARGVAIAGHVVATHVYSGDVDGFVRESHEAMVLPVAGFVPVDEAMQQPLATTKGVVAHAANIVDLQQPSVPLAEDVTATLKDSLNLHAEMLLRRLGELAMSQATQESPAEAVGMSPTAQGARVVRQWLLNAGLSGDAFVFFDGSGLSAKDLVSPRATTQLLAYAAGQPWFAIWQAALPVGGVDGTLEDRFKPGENVPAAVAALRGRVFAKTGTLGESRALAGYLDAASGQRLIFAIFVDNHMAGTAADRRVMDRVVAAIAAAN
jgi:D-alanyl-D-alanine carboxypeptidase/D-alanyl-D-alanine-endopeptidase (penicillin-binding protein 4)